MEFSFFVKIMTVALDDYKGGIKCAGRRILDLQFADNFFLYIK